MLCLFVLLFVLELFAVICKQEGSVCYLPRLSKNTTYYSVRRHSTQSKQIRKMYFNASFIKLIIISIYSLTTSTIISHRFIFMIILNQPGQEIPKQNPMVIGSFQKNLLTRAASLCGTQQLDQNLLFASRFWMMEFNTGGETAAHL